MLRICKICILPHALYLMLDLGLCGPDGVEGDMTSGYYPVLIQPGLPEVGSSPH